MNSILSILLFSIAAPFRHLLAFVLIVALPMLFSLFYFQTGGDWTVGLLPSGWQDYKHIEEDIVRYLCQALFLSLWYPVMVRQISGQKASIIGPGTLIFFMAYGFIFLLIKAIYWLATLMQISLFFIARGFNEGLADSVAFLTVVGIIMTGVGIIAAAIINRCSFGLPDCARGNYASIKDGWHQSSPYANQVLICTALLFGLDMLVEQFTQYVILENSIEPGATDGGWRDEIIQHIKRYLLLAMTAAMICNFTINPHSQARVKTDQ